MKALSIKQPWAWLICKGYKDIENRRWYTSFRGRIYVHAGKQRDEDGWDFIRDRISYNVWCQIWTMDWIEKLSVGALVGEVEVIDCIAHSSSPWFVGPYGLVLAKPVLYDVPIPCRGQLGFFEVKLEEVPG